MSKIQNVTIYARGMCNWNRSGGYAAILLSGTHRKELSGGFRATTKNRMDIIAAIEGLKALKAKCRVKIYNNNLYFIDSMVKGWVQRWKDNDWKTKENEDSANADLWEQLLSLCSQHIISSMNHPLV